MDQPQIEQPGQPAPGLLTTLVGRRAGPYLVEARLGGGAMAAVYRAVDQRDGRRVALKVLLPDADATVRERFRLEARMVSVLDHPNIVHTLEVSANAGQGALQAADDGLTFIAMEMVDGESLGDLLERVRVLNVADSCALLAPVARALHYAHAKNVVHRDVKPGNILLRRVAPGTPGSIRLTVLDGPVIPLLSDFGIARALDAPDLTSAGRTIGTPAYMSPEQCAGNRDIDGRADLYSLGAVLYRALVGRSPFVGTTTQILYSHVYDPVTIPEEVLRTFSPLLVDVLRRSLGKDPEDRYATAAEMADALALCAGGLPPARQSEAAAVPDQPTMTMADLAAASGGTLGMGQNTTTATVIVPAPRPLRPSTPARAPAEVVTQARPWVPPATVTSPARRVAAAAPGAAVEIFPGPESPRRAPSALRARGVLVGLSLAVPMVVLLGLAVAALLNMGPFAPAEMPPPSVTTVAQPTPPPTAAPAIAALTSTAAAEAVTPAKEAAVAAAAEPTVEPPPAVDATPTITPTLGPLPTPAGDINLFWADAQDFYAERDWDAALEWLTLVQRINPEFERAAVAEMLFNIHVALGNRETATNNLEAALDHYGEAVELNPDVRGVNALLNVTRSLLEAESADESADLPTARKLAQIAGITYAAELVRAERPCDAADQMETAVAILSEPQVVAYAETLRAQCSETETRLAEEKLLNELPGRLLYSTQVGDGHYRIFIVDTARDAPSAFLVDNARQPALSPNGRRIALYSTRNDAQGLAGFDLSSGLDPGARSILFTTNSGDGRDSPPSWNLQGSHLVYASVDPGDGRSRIFSVAADGKSDPDTMAEGQSPAWRWSSDFIAYNGVDENGQQPGLWLASPDGQRRVRLTDNGTDIRPVWSPGGAVLYFMSNGRSENWDVYSVDVPAGTVTQLTADPAQDGLPAVSPDGNTIAFMSDRGGSWNIWVQPLDGGEALRLTAIEGSLTNWLEHSLQWIP